MMPDLLILHPWQLQGTNIQTDTKKLLNKTSVEAGLVKCMGTFKA